MTALSIPIPATEGGIGMFVTFIVSLAATVVGHYICKWLDRH